MISKEESKVEVLMEEEVKQEEVKKTEVLVAKKAPLDFGAYKVDLPELAESEELKAADGESEYHCCEEEAFQEGDEDLEEEPEDYYDEDGVRVQKVVLDSDDDEEEVLEKAVPKEHASGNFVMVTEHSVMRKQLSFCISKLKENQKIQIAALGKLVSKAIVMAEISKARVGWLHQVSHMTTSFATEEQRHQIKVGVLIELSKDEADLDVTHPGYQKAKAPEYESKVSKFSLESKLNLAADPKKPVKTQGYGGPKTN